VPVLPDPVPQSVFYRICLPYIETCITYELFLYGAILAAAVTLLWHLYREERLSLAVTSAASEVFEIVFPYAAVALVAYAALQLFGAPTLDGALGVIERVADAAYSTEIASGMCLANIRLTPVASVYYEEARAKVQPFLGIVGHAYWAAKFFGTLFAVIIHVSAALLAIAPVFFLFPHTRRIGFAILAYVALQSVGFAAYHYSVLGEVEGKIGSVEIRTGLPGMPAKVVLEGMCGPPREFTAAPIFAVSDHCDNVLSEFLKCQVDVYAFFAAATDVYLALVALVLPATVAALSRH